MSVQLDLDYANAACGTLPLCEGAAVLRSFASPLLPELIAMIVEVSERSPFRHMLTPGGFRMSVAMTNCGPWGWVSDRLGYRYSETDPLTGAAWPGMPEIFSRLAEAAAAAAGFERFVPDACLINRYEAGTRLTLHQDKDERDFRQPIVSVSLGLPAIFLFGGPGRRDRYRRVALGHGDVVVWGGPARLFYHGVAPLEAGLHPETGERRLNLTFRRAR
jgi:alkylated DNA repair protein (DNA oxidative demethylase)